MADCYITSTGSYLPGNAVSNAEIQQYLGSVFGERKIKDKILRVNGITSRYYALDKAQQETESLYQLAAKSVGRCLERPGLPITIDYLSAGTTNAPLVAPGIASVLHDHLARAGLVTSPLEIGSNAGICTSGAQALVSAIRAVKCRDATSAVCVGAEQPSAILKSRNFKPVYDFATIMRDVKKSKWFMSVFLRFMLSDGAGAFLLQPQPIASGLSLRVNWTYSRSFANEAPLCMKLEKPSLRLSQDISVLNQFMSPLGARALGQAMTHFDDCIDSYSAVLPHLSSFYFAPAVRRALKEISRNKERTVPLWTNLASRGNIGSASIFVMLDEYLRTQPIQPNSRLLLFIPESGQFNYVFVSLTVIGSPSVQ